VSDGGEELLVGTILGQLTQLAGISYPIKIHKAEPLYEEVDGQTLYRRVVKVTMESGVYYVSVTDYDPKLAEHHIAEEP
jgi:hypothetical protein